MSDGISLLPHNEEAYQKLVNGLKDSQFVSINHATGTGKSFIMLKYLFDNRDKRILYLAPTYAILEQLVNEHIEELGVDKSSFNKLDTMIYRGLLNKDVSELASQYDIVILDEYHRCGALKWGKKIDELIETIKKNDLTTKVIGTTATEIRYLDNEKNMNEILFDGNCVSRITLADAILKGILPVPVYVIGSYELVDNLIAIEKRIRSSRLSIEKKNNYLLRVQELKEEAEEVMRNEKRLQEYIDSSGKYLVFSSRIESFYSDQQIIHKLIKDIDNEYMVSSDENKKSNSIYLKKFRDASSDETTVLYSVNLLNEGVHVKDVDAIFMLRPTSSPIIYFQQLGRLLSYSRRKDKVVIFDFVSNYRRHSIIHEVYDEVVSRAKKLMITDPENKDRYQKIIDNFKIVDFSSYVSRKIDLLNKETSYNKINIMVLEEAVSTLEKCIDIKDINMNLAYLNLNRLQKYVTIDIYDRVNRLNIAKPNIFNIPREDFIKFLGKYENIYQKDANKYKDLYTEVMNYYNIEGHLPSIFGKLTSEKKIAKRLLENFDKFSGTMKKNLITKMDNNLSIVELIIYGIGNLPEDRENLYSQIDKLIKMKVILNLNLIYVLRSGKRDKDKFYLNKIISSNDYLRKMEEEKESKFDEDDEVIKNIFQTNRVVLCREKFFTISEKVKEEYLAIYDKDKYLDDLGEEIKEFIILNKRSLRFGNGEEISPEDILYCKKVIFSQYLKKYNFNELLIPSKKKVSFDYLFEFMDKHQGGIPTDKSSDNLERIMARKFERNQDKMTEDDINKFNQYKKKYEKERCLIIKEYLDFINLYQRNPLSFNEEEVSLKERFERIRKLMSDDESKIVEDAISRLDKSIENNYILQEGQKRRERLRKNS